ncbi:unnamed protein product [Rotaria sordida]|uniref:Uncharacterized protein n=1 Tax=Rotaria sordida TaxID=392033 RepID=A0A814DLB8_9BILA|nr:unnamed protein product [Rotaria sordida]CAF1207006.1 unnamed protein product [Rotaria sordida]CAF1223808.1 unnamed protein product [Rotaria sordida]CAF1482273.1 unnamed protein product [Rotaria sordida]CAF3510143.1 unnamed protein product [Rotaria sordida]
MLPLLARLSTMRLNSSASLRILKRTQSIAVNQRSANRQQQALIRGGIALVAVGGAGYLLNKVLNSPTVAVPGAITQPKQMSFADAVEANRAFSPVVKEHLRSTYAHFAGGLAMTGTFAYIFHRTGWSARIMMMNKWAYLGVSLLGTIGALFATQAIDDQQNPGLKYTTWAIFNGAMGLTLAPIYFMQPALIARAALMTTGIVGSISAVGMTARREQYLWLGAPLMAGLVAVCLASIGSIALPATAIRTLSVLENVSLYGGLAVFSGLVLWDTQKIIAHAENAHYTRQQLSPINDALGIYLDFINIFIRILTIMDNRRRK